MLNTNPKAKVPELFALTAINPGYAGYFVDEHHNVWSALQGTVRRLTLHQGDWWYLRNGGKTDHVSYYNMSKMLNKCEKYITWRGKKKSEGVKGFVVTCAAGWTLPSTDKPKIYSSEIAAKQEAERLSTEYPGKVFAWLEIKGTIKTVDEYMF